MGAVALVPRNVTENATSVMLWWEDRIPTDILERVGRKFLFRIPMGSESIGKRALKAAGADPSLRLKDLRHCLAMWCTDAGMSEARVQSATRHKSASMTRIYAQQKDRAEAAKVMGDVLHSA